MVYTFTELPHSFLLSVTCSAFILAQLGAEAVCTGYSSFVNVITKRTLSFIFRSGAGGIVFARVVYDDPDWDHDYIKIWEKDKEFTPLLEERAVGSASGAADHQIIKLMRQVEDVVNFVYSGKKPAVEFADLNAAIDLQKMLNDINSHSGRYRAPIFSVKGHKRVVDYHNS